MFIDPQDSKAWGEELRMYQTQRKQAVEFQKPKIFTQKEMKEKQNEFHPVLQQYANPERDEAKRTQDMNKMSKNTHKQMEQRRKYMHEYDLVTLDQIPGIERPDERDKIKQNLLPSNFNDYNIITNEKISEEYYKNMKVIKMKKTIDKQPINRNKRDFNIINNVYFQHHDERMIDDKLHQDTKVLDNCSKVRVYNTVFNQFYDPQKENEYQDQLKVEGQNHGKDFNKRLPPSWKFRESVYLDQTKEVPQEIRQIDEIKKNNKKRYEVRHVLEQEYRERDVQDQLRAEDRVIHRAKYEDQIKKYDKEFDIITLDKPQIDHIIRALPPKPPQTTWEKVQMTKQQSIPSVSDVPIPEISIPDGIQFKEQPQQSRFPNIRSDKHKPPSDKSKAGSQASFARSEKSVPKSENRSQASEIKSGGFYLKQQQE